MRSARRAGVAYRTVGQLLLGVASAGCSTDTSRLAPDRTPPPDAGMAAGGGPAMGTAGAGGADPFQPLPTATPPNTMPPPLAAEPDGPTALTFLHGLVDAGVVYVCLPDEDGNYAGSPLPSSGIEYGHTHVVEGSAAETLLERGTRPLIVTGSGAEDLDCEQAAIREQNAPLLNDNADAGVRDRLTTALRVFAFPAIPPAVLQAERSYLMAWVGCLGGAGQTEERQAGICGAGYAPAIPTATAFLVQLSRVTRFDSVGLQFHHGSLGTALLTARSAPGFDTQGAVVTIGSDVTSGQLEPTVPSGTTPLSIFGIAIEPQLLRVSFAGDSNPAFQEPWRRAMSRGALDAVEDGQNYTAVYLGPRPDIRDDGWWNPPVFTVVANDPAAAEAP